MFKRFTALCLVVALSVLAVTACKDNNNGLKREGRPSIICTVAPSYDWVNEILGDRMDEFSVTLLSGSGDMHSFQPTAKDIVNIRTSDLIVSVGGVSEAWLDGIELEKNVKKIGLFDFVQEDERLVYGGNEHNHEHEGHTDNEYDEHIWLSLRLAEGQVRGICDFICDLDPQYGVFYRKNAEDYCQRLKDLQGKYSDVVQGATDKTVVFADRFPFAYLMRDFGIECFAAFPGCAADTDASFETIVELADKVKAHNERTLLVLEDSKQSVADAVKNSLGVSMLDTAVMNSCQSVDNSNIQEFDYIEVMEKNLEALKLAL